MRVLTRAKRLRFSRKLCLAVIPVGWLVIFITLSLYNDHENTGKLLLFLVSARCLSQIAVKEQGRSNNDSTGMRRTNVSITVQTMLVYSGADPGFQIRGFDLGPPKAVPCRGVRGHPSPENFEIQVLGNAISDVLRPSNGVLKSCVFKPKCHSFASKYCKTTLK